MVSWRSHGGKNSLLLWLKPSIDILRNQQFSMFLKEGGGGREKMKVNFRSEKKSWLKFRKKSQFSVVT